MTRSVSARDAYLGFVSSLLGLLALTFVAPGVATAAVAATPTSVTLTVTSTPAGRVGSFTPVEFDSMVTPSVAPGTVAFRVDGRLLQQVRVVAGHARATSSFQPVGDRVVTAEFVPDATDVYASSQAIPVVLSVMPDVRVWLTDSADRLVSEGSMVRVGSHLVLHASGFTPNAKAKVALGVRPLPVVLMMDRGGAGSRPIVVPDVPSTTTSLVVDDTVVQGSFSLYIYNPRVTPTPTPTPTPTRSATPMPVSTPAPSATGAVPVTVVVPSSSAPSALAHTGWDGLSVGMLGFLLSLTGATISWRARPMTTGAHTRG